MIQTLLARNWKRLTDSLKLGRDARRRSFCLLARPEPLEIRTLLAANVLAQVAGGNLYLTGADAGSRTLVASQDLTDSTLLDLQPGDNTTINGSASTLQIKGSAVTGSVFVYLNNGSGTANTTTLTSTVSSLVFPSNVYLTLVGNGGNSVSVTGGGIKGSLVVHTGGGDDDIEASNVSVGGSTRVDTGTGSDFVKIDDSTLHAVTLTEGVGADDSVNMSGDSTGSIKIEEGGTQTKSFLENLTVNGDLNVKQAAGDQAVDINSSTVTGAVGIVVGNSRQHSSLFFGSDTFGSASFTGGAGGYAFETVDLTVKRGFSITSGAGNTDIGILGTSNIGGQTTLLAGDGNMVIGIAGSVSALLPPASTFGAVAIRIGNGQSAIGLNNLSATSLTVSTGTGANTIGIGGPIDIPANPGDLYGLSGSTLGCGAATFSGPVVVTNMGANSLQIQQTTFNSSFTYYAAAGQNTLTVGSSTLNGTASITMAGTGNAINVQTDPAVTTGTTFKGLAVFNFNGATKVGGGGTISLGTASGSAVQFTQPVYFVGAFVKKSSALTFNQNPILILSVFV